MNPVLKGPPPDHDDIFGAGELPFRPAPTNPFADPNNSSTLAPLDEAQGLYVPNAGFGAALAEDNFEFAPNQNFSQTELSLNHGASQDPFYELKEAYVDLEMLDHHLWLRLGLQTIVWGKTELFRAQDQFNPQDLAIASLPSLEESRVPPVVGPRHLVLLRRGPPAGRAPRARPQLRQGLPGRHRALRRALRTPGVVHAGLRLLRRRPGRNRHRRRVPLPLPVEGPAEPRGRRAARVPPGPYQLRPHLLHRLRRLPLPGADLRLRTQRGSPDRPSPAGGARGRAAIRRACSASPTSRAAWAYSTTARRFQASTSTRTTAAISSRNSSETHSRTTMRISSSSPPSAAPRSPWATR